MKIFKIKKIINIKYLLMYLYFIFIMKISLLLYYLISFNDFIYLLIHIFVRLFYEA
jgi:hypothetical protein